MRVKSAGAIACDLLSGTGTGTVYGISSRGWFLRVFDQRVVFLSREVYRGPITVNTVGLPAEDPGLEPGAAVEVRNGRISIPAASVALSIRHAERWETGLLTGSQPARSEVTGRLTSVSLRIYTAKAPAGLSRLLPFLVDLPVEGEDHLGVLDSLRDCQAALRDRQLPRIDISLRRLYGLGNGLTPSGDDLILGLVLTLNRVAPWFPDRAGLEQLNQQVVQTARERTTSLSANLIECAAQGQADERLVDALDGILTGNTPVDACAEALSNWGSSSGADALAGMALALTGAGFANGRNFQPG